MKKTFAAAVAVLCLTGCVQEEIVNGPKSEAIAFSGAFVENATRATSFTKDNLTGFNVWGFMNNTNGPVFEGTEVKREGDIWSYEGEERYWIPGQTYYFSALAPMSSDQIAVDCASGDAAKQGLGTMTFTNVDGTEDLIYSSCSVVGQKSGNQPVAFTFEHLLSKVKFTFTNHMGNDYIHVKVTNVKMSAPKVASIDLTAANPSWVSSTDGEFNFGSIEIPARDSGNTDDFFVVPASASYSYQISFDIDLVMEGVEEVLYHATKTSTVTGVALEKGTAYNFSAAINPDILNLETVTFEVECVQGWDTASDLSKIAIASKLGGEVTLSGNVTVPRVIEVVEDLTINLNGKTLSYNGDNRMFKVVEGATLTINGNDNEESSVVVNSENLNASTTAAYIATAYANSNIVINGGKHTTNGCTLYHTDGGKIEINSGEFAATETGYDPAGKWGYKYALNIQGSNGEIVVNGGSFYKWNPSNSEGENPAANFVAEGLEVVIEGDWCVVKEQPQELIVSNVTEFKSAILDPQVSAIKATADITISSYSQDFNLNNRGAVTLDMNGYTFRGQETTTNASGGYSGVVTNDTKLTVNNGKFTGGGFQVGYANSELTLNNCDITITATTTNGRYCIYAVEKAVVTVNGGTYNLGTQGQRIYFYAGADATIHITNCVCGAKSNDSRYPPIKTENGGRVIITGGTFGFDPTAWVPSETHTCTKSGSTWTVQQKNQ